MYYPRTTWSIAFFAVVTVQAAVVLAFEGYTFGKYEYETWGAQHKGRTIPTYLALFIFAFCCSFFLAYDALRLKNMIQIFVLCFFNIALLTYSALQVDQIKTSIAHIGPLPFKSPNLWVELRPFLVSIPCMIAFCSVILAFISYKLYHEVGWTIYKHIGPDRILRRRFLCYQVLITFLKFDFLFFLGFTVQFVVIVLDIRDIEFTLTIAVIPVTILILLLCTWAVVNEKYWAMVIVQLFFFGGLAYFFFKLVRMYEPDQAYKYLDARKTLTTFAVITIVFLIVTIVFSVICTSNFGKGLKNYVQPKRSSKGQRDDQMSPLSSSYYPYSHGSASNFENYDFNVSAKSPVTRMVID